MNIPARTAFPALFLALSLAVFGWVNLQRPRILILHSYDPSYAWSRDVSEGLRRVLSDNFRYQLRWHYMDTKRHPTEAFRQSAGSAAQHVIRGMQPDVVIAIDDDAQDYVVRHFIGDPHIQFVFTGVNHPPAAYRFEQARNITGILEQVPLAAIREALLSVRSGAGAQQPRRLAYLGDKSNGVAAVVQQVNAFDWQPLQLHTALQVRTWPEWQATVLGLQGKTDMLMLTGYRQLHRSATDTRPVPAQEVVAWTEANAPVPVFSGKSFYTEDGGMLAIGTSPYEQGEEAARLALKLALEHRSAAEFPIATASQFVVAMNAGLMRKRQMALPAIYESAARSANKYQP